MYQAEKNLIINDHIIYSIAPKYNSMYCKNRAFKF